MKAALRDLQRQAAAELPSQGLHEDLSARAKVPVQSVMYSTGKKTPGVVQYRYCTGYSVLYRYMYCSVQYRVPVPYCTGKKTLGGAGSHTGHKRDTRARTGTCMSRLPPCLFTGTVFFRQTSKIASSQRARCVLFLFSKPCSKPSLPCFEGDINAHDGALPLRYRTLTGSKTPGERGNRGAGTFGIEFGYICYQDTYPDVSCVYPEGYMYPDVS